MKFKVGDKVKGLSDIYEYTNTNMYLGEVKKVNEHFTYNFIANRVEFISKASKSTNKVETPQEQAKNGSNEEIFKQFGEQIEITDDMIAF